MNFRKEITSSHSEKFTCTKHVTNPLHMFNKKKTMISACPVRATRPARAFVSFILFFAVLKKTTRLDQIWSPMEGVSTRLLNFPFFLPTFRSLNFWTIIAHSKEEKCLCYRQCELFFWKDVLVVVPPPLLKYHNTQPRLHAIATSTSLIYKARRSAFAIHTDISTLCLFQPKLPFQRSFLFTGGKRNLK